MANRAQQQLSVHDSWVKYIARQKMSFPNEEHPSWATYTNEPTATMGVTVGERTLFPDMVVVDDGNNLVMIGEVETASSVTTADAQQWREYGNLCPTFFLYVPEGRETAARELGHSANITGIRAYSVGNDRTARIRNV